MFVCTDYISFLLVLFFYFFYIFICSFIFFVSFYYFCFCFLFSFYLFVFFFMCSLFRGNSLNSRADLEFKEFRLFSTIIFQKKIESLCFFFKNPNVFFFFHDDFSKIKRLNFNCFLKNHRGQKSKFLKFKVRPATFLLQKEETKLHWKDQ